MTQGISPWCFHPNAMFKPVTLELQPGHPHEGAAATKARDPSYTYLSWCDIHANSVGRPIGLRTRRYVLVCFGNAYLGANSCRCCSWIAIVLALGHSIIFQNLVEPQKSNLWLEILYSSLYKYSSTFF
jgi:hypothetical protein